MQSGWEIYLCFQADLRRADFRAKQRAMEDALMALEVISKSYLLQYWCIFHAYTSCVLFWLQFIKNIHDMMVQKMVDSL